MLVANCNSNINCKSFPFFLLPCRADCRGLSDSTKWPLHDPYLTDVTRLYVKAKTNANKKEIDNEKSI